MVGVKNRPFHNIKHVLFERKPGRLTCGTPMNHQEVRPFCAGVGYIKRRQVQAANVQLIPEHTPHHGGHPGEG